MSVLGKKWHIVNSSEKSSFEKLLENRGLDLTQELEEFHDPFLLSDMEKALQRIQLAINNQDRILIFGDYDVDGISATAILVHTLQKLKANVSYRLPHRVDDGYGLSLKFIEEFTEKEIKLLITVDCGIACIKEVELANQHGIDVIVTDHHTIPAELPAAYAILHPLHLTGYPCGNLTGAGVALKLAQALLQRENAGDSEEILDTLLDFACLGTIADMVPLKGENRLIVRRGLHNLRDTKWLGIQALKQFSGIEANSVCDTYSVGFQIAPRINAAGRIGDPYLALSLLLENQDPAKAKQLAEKLDNLNLARRNMTEHGIISVQEKIDPDNLPAIIIEKSADWHAGVIGLLAGKLSEKYNRPSIVCQEMEGQIVGSARSPEYFNIVEAIGACSEHLISFGGHAQAAGFSVSKENFPKFAEKIQVYSEAKVATLIEEVKPTLRIDCEISQEELNRDFAAKITSLQPFGVGNQKPTFLLRDLEIHNPSLVGSDGKHLSFSAFNSNEKLRVIAFNMGSHAANCRQGEKIDLVCSFEQKIWQGKEYLELMALDFALASR